MTLLETSTRKKELQKNLAPKVQAFVEELVQNKLGAVFNLFSQKYDQDFKMMDEGFEAIEGGFQKLELVVNNLSFRLEALYLMLEKTKVINKELQAQAAKEFAIFRAQLIGLHKLPMKEKLIGLKEWNEVAEEHLKISAADIEIPMKLLDKKEDPDLTLEERIAIANELELGEQFIQALEKSFTEPPAEEEGEKTDDAQS